MLPTYTLLTIALLMLWVVPHRFSPTARACGWAVPFVLAVISAWWSGIVQPVALAWLATLVVAAAMFSRAAAGSWQRTIAGGAILVLGVGLMSHQLPGFNSPRVLAAVRLSPDALAYSLRLNFDKAAFGLIFLAICHPRIRQPGEWRAMLTAAAPVAAGLIALMTVLALASSYVRFDPKFPPEAWRWMWANLFLTCVGEEALFRGLVQRQLQQQWEKRRGGTSLALVVAAVLFGLAHFAGGPAYVALSSVAGVGYGWSYLRSGGRIEASILTHFALNSLHFFGFTYPALARG